MSLLRRFSGGPSLRVNITNRSVNNPLADSGENAYAAYYLAANGQAYSWTQDGADPIIQANFSGEWLTSGDSSQFEVYALRVSGSNPGGTVGAPGSATNTWLSLSTTRNWGVISYSAIEPITNSAQILVTIRNASTQQNLDSATITISATGGITGAP